MNNIFNSNVEQKDIPQQKYHKICWVSVLSLFVSISAFICFAGVLGASSNARLAYYTWIVAMVLSPFVPLFAKRTRTRKNQKGKACEIIAMVLACFNVDFFLAYILHIISGWTTWFAIIFCIVLYKIVPVAKLEISEGSSVPDDVASTATEEMAKEECVTNLFPSEISEMQKESEEIAIPAKQSNHSAVEVESNQDYYCKRCGFRLLPDSAFCSHCGEPVPEPGNHCLACGVELPDDAQFCHICGCKIE